MGLGEVPSSIGMYAAWKLQYLSGIAMHASDGRGSGYCERLTYLPSQLKRAYMYDARKALERTGVALEKFPNAQRQDYHHIALMRGACWLVKVSWPS